MNLIRCLFILCTFLILSSVVPNLRAEENNRLKGTLSGGVIVINSSDNLNPSGSEEYLDNLDHAAGTESSVLPVLIPDITFDPGAEGGMELYLNGTSPIDEAGGFALNAGATRPFPGWATVALGAFISPLKKAWENPYLLGEKREETGVDIYGGKAAFNRIADTNLSVEAVILSEDVDDDRIGLIEPDLARDGIVYATTIATAFSLSPALSLRPRLSLRRGAYDGDSNSFFKAKIELGVRYSSGQWTVLPSIAYNRSEYDATDPIFNATRRSNDFSLKTLVLYSAPFGWERWTAQGLLGISKGDSNIAFYDSQSVTAGLFLAYAF